MGKYLCVGYVYMFVLMVGNKGGRLRLTMHCRKNASSGSHEHKHRISRPGAYPKSPATLTVINVRIVKFTRIINFVGSKVSEF